MQSQLFYYSIDYRCAAKGVLVPCVLMNTRMHEHRVCFVHLWLAQRTTHVHICCFSKSNPSRFYRHHLLCALQHPTQELCKGQVLLTVV